MSDYKLNFRSIISVLVVFVACSLPCQAADSPPSMRKVLFFDLWKLDAWSNLELRQGEPEWVRECDYRDPSAESRGVYFPSVWIDEASGKWRMVHSTKWSPLTLMSAESDDGISWRPLAVPDAEVGDGEKLAPNHLLTVPSGSGSPIYHDPQVTDGYPYRMFGRQGGEPLLKRALANENHRWYKIAKAEGEKKYFSEGITMVSKDGLHWEVKTGGDWDWNAEDWFPEPPVFAFWNPLSQQHVMTVRPGWGDRRQCLRTTADFRKWGEPELQFQPDPLDTDGPIGMYGLPVKAVGNGAGFVGLLWIFHNSSSEPVGSFNQFFGTMDAQLVYSYDGERFFRGLREPFLKLNPIPQPGCTQIRACSMVETADAIHIYSEANRGAHGRERSEQRQTEEPLGSLMLHTLRPDGWMFLASKGDWASFQTKPFTLFASQIDLNAAAKYGEVRFQLSNEKSQPLEGFTFDDCVPLKAEDALKHRLAWKDKSDTDMEQLVGKVLRLEIKFRQANIYSLAMAHHFLDAHDMRLLEDGKPLPGVRRFDF